MMSAARQLAPARGPRDVLAGLVALVALLAMLGGVPLALFLFFGSPIPQSLPSAATLTQQLGPGTLIHVLVVLVWLAWLQLAICVLIEAYAAVRGVGVPVRVPLAGGAQALAHRLVVAALFLFTATTTVMPVLTAAQQPRPVYSQSQVYVPPDSSAVSTGQGVEQSQPATAQEIAAHPMAAQHGVRKIYRVLPPAGRHHESLWEIAEKCLGDGRRYHEIYALNKGRPQPDGSRLTMASLIRPGWVLDMPQDATGVETIETGTPPPPANPAPAPVRPAPTHPAPTPPTHTAPAQPAPQQPVTPTPEQRAVQQKAALKAAQQKEEAEKRAAEHAVDHSSPQHKGHESSDLGWGWPQELAVASLLAAGLLAALGRRRREQLWHRAFGYMIARPQGEAAVAEAALRIGADTEATRLLDLGLRQMSKSLAADGRTLPTVYGVHLGQESLDLWIATPDRNPPVPWEEHDDGQVWRLRNGALDELVAADLSDVLAPYPGLVSIGANETGQILVDLEAAHGLIALRGPDTARRAVLAAIAVELATNRWSDHMRITLVGFGEELALVAPDRIRAVATLQEALPELEGRTEEVRQALAASGVDSVLTGRCRGVFGEAWMPHYLIMADEPKPEEVERLTALARTGQRMAAGYVVAGDVDGATWTWDASSEGRLRAGLLGFEVAAQLIPERHYRAVVELFRTAGRMDGLAYAGREVEPAVPPPLAGVAGFESSMTGVGARPVVDIRLLGPIEVDAPEPMEEGRQALCTEVLVYLATHPEGVHPTVLGGAVWPRGVAAGVRDATIARVADWLGRDSRDRPNLYYDERGRIRLGSEVRVDWEVFRWLAWRSAAEPASEVAYMSYALDLVRGPLLHGHPRGRYGWLAAEDLEYEATARVADVSHRLVLMRLDGGDARGAMAAARAGLRMAPEDEGLWRDLLRATHATGDHAQLRSVIEDLRKRLEEDSYVGQMQPETEALADELMPEWRGVAAAGS
jgi:Bacterial transcriptional activator domain